MNPKLTKKEQGLVKGALRRIFSRSDMRRHAIEMASIPGFKDARKPRVKKWARCQLCFSICPAYLMEVDHIEPVVPVTSSLGKMTVDELVDHIWCGEDNLQVLCLTCHKNKSKIEAGLRRASKKRGI